MMKTLRNTTVRSLTIAAASFAMTAALLAPLAAHAKETVAAPTTLVRPGDRAMTCEALAGEINLLAAAGPTAKPKKKRGGLGFLKMLSAVTPLAAMTNSGVLGSVASQAAGMAQQEAMQGQMDGAMEASMNALNPHKSVEAQRKDRLSAIFEEKRC